VTFDATITAADKRLLGTAGTGNDWIWNLRRPRRFDRFVGVAVELRQTYGGN
jgi:hypothetical protein